MQSGKTRVEEGESTLSTSAAKNILIGLDKSVCVVICMHGSHIGIVHEINFNL